jgi:hypothetical protein
MTQQKDTGGLTPVQFSAYLLKFKFIKIKSFAEKAVRLRQIRPFIVTKIKP